MRRTFLRSDRASRTRWSARRRVGWIALALATLLAVSACGSQGDVVVTVTSTAGAPVTVSGLDQSAAPTSESTALNTKVRVSSKPKFGSTDVAPADPVTVTLFSATMKDLTVTGDDGSTVTGTISEDKATWTLGQRLSYNTTYTFNGTAVDTDGNEVPFTGTLQTVKPEKTPRASFQIPSGTTVGVAAPVIITFAEAITDKAAAQATFKLTTDKGDIKGSWGWLQDEDIQGTGVKQSIVHFRPAEFWPANTNVHVEANLQGVNYGGGAWGKEDISTDFTVGRKQVVQADVTTFHMVVLVDDQVVKNYPVSYGKESVPGRATVSGIHVVTEKYPTFSMCNPEFDYCNVEEKWAVRINNNGEFIHENALTTPYLGKENVSHGCINMGVGDAEEYYNSALYGDPVIVSNTGAQMSEKDSIYDWIYSFADWQKLSAL
ncbi:L,D-transpeptidase [Nakamurella multipartita]|uniref:ErfK/YbiS/YcfS/YnhG family protein n=1 Tax=Nakamurella multipartita (strain ATCC 700099 / DSM 44233 / CIP 104796 / JCM 9543 / NBRC 105858 / Y-104) TaxID=479431 RepID=C8XA10_NAKMY|nr:Ig-like domain-containing protein [Nakamurella multipartita]ACV81210.1 ErfK/YbiS/YcfS/YnhG family protein [Nakamurella multipartita DSM 44233]